MPSNLPPGISAYHVPGNEPPSRPDPPGMAKRLRSIQEEYHRNNMPEPLKPSPALLAKLGSIVIHAKEFIEEPRHEARMFDLNAAVALMEDEDVREWLREMDALQLLPKRR